MSTPNYKSTLLQELEKETPNLETIKKCFRLGKLDVNLTNKKLETPLFIACKMGHELIVETLLRKPGIDVNKATQNEETPLYIACLHGYLPVVKKLLTFPGIDVNKSEYHGETPLFTACYNGHTQIVEKLLEFPRIDVNKSTYRYNTTPLACSFKRQHYEIADKLLDVPGIDVNRGLITPLYMAVSNNKMDLFKKLLTIPGIDVNKGNVHDLTPLLKACQKNNIEMVKILIEDTRVNKEDAIEQAETFSEEIQKLFTTFESKFKILWTGFSRADIDFTNSVFNEVIKEKDLAISSSEEVLFSICPVCLKYVQHISGSCMYMSHSCKSQAGFEGYYHKKLWKAFSDGVIQWCTHCGRICKNHEHYELAPLYNEDGSINKPKLIKGGSFFAVDCSDPKIGGGGRREKIIRYRKLREVVLELNSPSLIGKITYEDAINKLVEAVWEAPLEKTQVNIHKIIEEKQYNEPVRNALFPMPSELPPPPKYKYEIPSYPGIINPDLLPLVYPNATNTIKNSAYSMFGDDENIVQFRHRMTNNVINNHDGPNQQIALGRLIGYIQHMNDSPGSNDFGKCWQHSRQAYAELLDDPTHIPPQCTARLYPEELFHAIQIATYSNETEKEENMKVYTRYLKLFSEKFGKPIGLANESNLKGGRRRTRRIRRN